MTRRSEWVGAALLITIALAPQAAGAQGELDRRTLGAEVEQRFEVLPLQSGMALRPKRAMNGVRSIELSDGTIAVDGEPVTGAELRRRLGRDADVVIQLTYLDPAARRRLFRLPDERAGTSPATAPATPDRSTPVPESTPARTRESDDRVRIGGGVRIEADEVVNGDVVAIGGGVYVDGRVSGEVVAIGGGVVLGPHADIARDVTVVGGGLRRDPAARVGGKVNEIGIGALNLGGLRVGRFHRYVGRDWGFGSLVALVSTMMRLVVLCLLAAVVVVLGQEYVERVGARAADEPVKAGLVGLLIQLLFVPMLVVTIIVLVVTIIGIPLLILVPFALLALAVLLVVGFTAVAYDLGRLAAARLGWADRGPYLTAMLGVLLVLAPALVARLVGLGGGLLFPITAALVVIAFLVEYAAWTVGLGAIALLRFNRRGSTAAQPLAPPTSAA